MPSLKAEPGPDKELMPILLDTIGDPWLLIGGSCSCSLCAISGRDNCASCGSMSDRGACGAYSGCAYAGSDLIKPDAEDEGLEYAERSEFSIEAVRGMVC